MTTHHHPNDPAVTAALEARLAERHAELIIRATLKPSLPDTSEITANEIIIALTNAGFSFVEKR